MMKAKNKGKDQYDNDLIYSRFLALRRRYADEDEPIKLGQHLKEKTIPKGDKCGI